MATYDAPTIKSPGVESAKGNLSADVIEYNFTGNEADGDILKLRRMSEYNTYVRVTIVGNANLNALTAVSLGYINREGGADVLDAFSASLDVQSNAFSAVLTDFVKPGAKHDISLRIDTNNVANAGEKIKILMEFVNVAG